MRELLPTVRNDFFWPFQVKLDELISDFFKDTSGVKSAGGYPRMDIYCEGNEFVIRASIPGVKKEDVGLEVENNTITITGKMDEQYQVKDELFYIRELRKGKFSRTITLPDFIVGDPQAEMADGLLTIKWKINKEDVKTRPKQIEIKSK